MNWFKRKKFKRTSNTYSNTYSSGGFDLEEMVIILKIRNILSDMVDDYNDNKYKDKFEVVKNDTAVVYTFEDGRTLEYGLKYLIYNDKEYIKTYTVSALVFKEISKIIEKIITDLNENGVDRKIKKGKERPDCKIEQKRIVYNKLLETISLRLSQINNLMDNDPEKESLEIELENVRSKADQMKLKYNF